MRQARRTAAVALSALETFGGGTAAARTPPSEPPGDTETSGADDPRDSGGVGARQCGRLGDV